MNTTHHAIAVDDAMAIQIAAAERLERAEASLHAVTSRLRSLVPGAPLRYGVEATARYRQALAERDAAQAAYDAAQDIECPEGAAS